MTLGKLISKIDRKLNPPVDAVDDAAVLARLMAETDRVHDRLRAEGMTPPTPAQLAVFMVEWDAMYPSEAWGT
jgi:hypothetical protein